MFYFIKCNQNDEHNFDGTEVLEGPYDTLENCEDDMVCFSNSNDDTFYRIIDDKDLELFVVEKSKVRKV